MAARVLARAAILASAFALPQSPLQAHVFSRGDTPANPHAVVPNFAPPQPLGGSDASSFFSPAWIPHGEDLTPKLSQTSTNGNSNWGTLNQPPTPSYMPGSPMPNGSPWGDTTPCGSPPNTGVTRSYEITITSQNIAPDGVVRSAMVANGGFPGPLIEANWGDWIQVTVNNQLADEGTSLHWHGMLQQETPYMDGVPGITQCPIAPGQSFTYRFRASLYGTSWYHSHYSAQYAGGVLGPMIIYGPSANAQYDEDLGPIMIGDWYHQSYYDLVEQVMAPASEGLFPPSSQNSLINGKMNFPCANATGYQCTPNAGVSKFQLQSGTTYRLRIINVGAEGIQKFSIDGYTLTVIANDFVPIVPYQTQVVTLGVGQRTDVILTANGSPTSSMWMRANLGTSAFKGGCTLNNGVSPMGVAAMYYQNANTSAVPNTTYDVPSSVVETCANDPLTETVPFCPAPVNTTNVDVQSFSITYQSNGTNDLFFVNNSTFRADYNSPVLFEAEQGTKNYSSDSNCYMFPNSTAVRFIVYNYALTGAHPMHMHGHNMQILAVGSGIWNGAITNPSNPQQRDVQLLPNAVSASEPSYIVVQFEADNPGVWPFHCHIAWHVSAGLYINIVENQPQIQAGMNIPSIMPQTCTDWDAWTSKDTPDEIDSGL